MEITFTGRSVFLTGGSRGIGREIERVFENSNATVLAPTREELNLLDSSSIQRYLESNPDLKPDVFIHCAGLNELGGINEISKEKLDRVFQVNFFAAVELASGFIRHMEEQRWGRILFISSLYSVISKERRIAYSSAKSALNGLIRTMALELAPSNILVNGIAPGYVLTNMTYKNLSAQEIRDIERNIPTGRFQKEEEVANLSAFLCSSLNESITGQTLVIDGGYTCK